MTGQQLRSLLIFLAICLYNVAAGDTVSTVAEGYQVIELETDTLPDLNATRSGHRTLYVDGQLTVVGGHTNGFVPIATIEYLQDGSWHTVDMVYAHDQATVLVLRSGKILVAGGHKDDIGIGQQFATELYDPVTHTTSAHNCMSLKRAFANAVELADGQIVISGNWYADDGIEMFDNIYDKLDFNARFIKPTSVPRAAPYVLRISDDDVIIFGPQDSKGGFISPSTVDRLKGVSYHEPFLDTYIPLHIDITEHSDNLFIGDVAKERYEWLLPVIDETSNQVSIARVCGAQADSVAAFSLLTTDRPVPGRIGGQDIRYFSLVCDRDREIAYLIGNNDESCVIVVAIPYNMTGPAPMTVYITKPQPVSMGSTTPVLTPEGDLVIAGGHLISNFSPSASVIRLPLGSSGGSASLAAAATETDPGGKGPVPYIIVGIVICLILTILVVGRLRSKKIKARLDVAVPEAAADPAPGASNDGAKADSITDTTADTTADVTSDVASDIASDKNMPKDDLIDELIKRIDQLMDDEKPFLDANLRISDVAVKLGSNTSYVSSAINSRRGCSFSQYLTNYRIAYAQQLMRENPHRKIFDISILSGFATDSTFFRAFKSITGMSPKEWLSALDEQQQQQ